MSPICPPTIIAGSSPGHELAKKLVESIKEKKGMDEILELANSIPSQVPEDVEMDETQGIPMDTATSTTRDATDTDK